MNNGKHILVTSLWIVLFFLKTIHTRAQNDTAWQEIDNRPAVEWFGNAKFGIFIHWGVYSVPSWAPITKKTDDQYAEWYWKQLEGDRDVNKKFRDFHEKVYGPRTTYQDFAGKFSAELFDPVKWADIIAQSGAKYVILTAKHHDGFTLWPSKQAWNWNAVDIGPRKDLVGSLTTAIRQKNLKMGYYYSLYEWYNPKYADDFDQYRDIHMYPQIKDLVDTYQPDILWVDGEWDHTWKEWKSTEILHWLYNDSKAKSNIIVNDRWGKDTRGKHGDFYTSEYGKGYEQMIHHKPWEECRGMGGSFGYNRNENLNDYLTSKQLVELLISTVSRGGNLLLNIGPRADGTIPVIMQQRLQDIGKWLAVNGESIYDSKPWLTDSTNNSPSTFFTQNGESLYVLTTKWPGKNIVIHHVNRKPSTIKLLGYDGKISFDYHDQKLKINMPALSPSTNLPVGAWVFKVEQTLK